MNDLKEPRKMMKDHSVMVCTDTGGDGKGQERSVSVRAYPDQRGSQNATSPFTTFSLFYDGQLVPHEILWEKKFDKILANKEI